MSASNNTQKVINSLIFKIIRLISLVMCCFMKIVFHMLLILITIMISVLSLPIPHNYNHDCDDINFSNNHVFIPTLTNTNIAIGTATNTNVIANINNAIESHLTNTSNDNVSNMNEHNVTICRFTRSKCAPTWIDHT
ncbi:hypothetical protein V8G54_004970 [Vigna mungo]|uniref:Uncharacterized protein n=1 Tax=Vigna mungo TaxID=3915 RepID=A0AAQ3PCM9_VIGMU